MTWLWIVLGIVLSVAAVVGLIVAFFAWWTVKETEK